MLIAIRDSGVAQETLEDLGLKSVAVSNLSTGSAGLVAGSFHWIICPAMIPRAFRRVATTCSEDTSIAPVIRSLWAPSEVFDDIVRPT